MAGAAFNDMDYLFSTAWTSDYTDSELWGKLLFYS